MKKYLIVLCTILLGIYIVETIEVFPFQRERPITTLTTKNGQSVLSWSKISYPCYFEIEILTPDTNRNIDDRNYRVLRKEYTLRNQLIMPVTPLPVYYRVTPHGLFHPIGQPSEILESQTALPLNPLPEIISKYDAQNPASRQPLLTWHTVPGAVYYELEILTDPPENPNGTELSRHSWFHTRQVFTNGYYADLSQYPSHLLYWRIRALDFDANPVGVFSNVQSLCIDDKLLSMQKPIINTIDRLSELSLPLYPVYNWIPLNGIKTYEVELLDEPPEIENGTQPSASRIWSKITEDASDCYDDFARLFPGTYYWRVRGIDKNGNTIGVYSDTESFTVSRQPKRVSAATFGDSITHGGGAVSYSPANLEYSYQTYLDFPSLNLGKSGDTSTTMAERFDSDVLPFRPKNLFILCGANSIRAGTPASTIIRDLISIRTKCYANDIRPIFLTLLPIHPDNIYRAFSAETANNWRKELREVNAFIRKQPYMIDLEPYFYDDAGFLAAEFATDGLHPDINGKKLMAEIINVHKKRVLR